MEKPEDLEELMDMPEKTKAYVKEKEIILE